jgi:hypothetical protein
LRKADPPRPLSRIRRLVFLYLFRDYGKGTLDTGIEFTTLLPLTGRRILCKAITLNIKGLRKDTFVVDRLTRKIRGLRGRYVCYWINRNSKSVRVYDRLYREHSEGTYLHASAKAESEIKFDDKGFERRAENLVFSPRQYHEVFVRLISF